MMQLFTEEEFMPSLQTHHVESTFKRRGNGRFHVASTWNPRGVFVAIIAFSFRIEKIQFIQDLYRTLEIAKIYLRLLEKHNASQLPLFVCFPPSLFWNNGEFGAKKYFTDIQTANTVQLFTAIKGNFSGLLIF